MSLGDDDEFWNTSSVKAFNFDDEDNQPHPHVKTLGSVLAAKTPSNEPFLRPSIVMCHGRNKIDLLIDYLDQGASNTRNKAPRQDPKSYINDIVNNGVQIEFSPYKSRRDKLLLLDCAICCCDGNTIMAVTIFLSKTLKQSIFVEELKKRPIAVNHYINYLEITERSRDALELANMIQK